MTRKELEQMQVALDRYDYATKMGRLLSAGGQIDVQASIELEPDGSPGSDWDSCAIAFETKVARNLISLAVAAERVHFANELRLLGVDPDEAQEIVVNGEGAL